MSQSSTNHVGFIDDKPADADFFGGHAKLARILARIIEEPNNVRVIGLIGGWGSGKSTVVNLTKAAMEARNVERDATYFFIFDAWLHQNDPPRRSFIESLIAFLSSPGIQLINSEDWEDDLNKLSRRTEEQEVETSPTLTAWGKVVAISFLLVPLGHIVLEEGWSWLGLFLSFAPLFVILSNGFIRLGKRIKGAFGQRGSRSEKATSESHNSVFSAFVNKSIEKETSRTIKTPDPTAIEFRNIYERVMSEAASSAGLESRFVFVIDNLDRIPEPQAVEIWSTVQSFFVDRSIELAGLEEDTKFQPPWVVIPIEPSAIQQMHQPQGGNTDEVRSQSFVEKTFDTVLYVGPPVSSQWELFLAERFRQALKGLATEESVAQAKIVFGLRPAGGHLHGYVTPRNINSFVNRVAALCYEWTDSRLMPAVLYYAAFSSELVLDVKTLLEASDHKKNVMNALDPDWQIHVASIFYGASESDAAHLLLSDELRKAILEGNREVFDNCMEVPGSSRVMQELVWHEIGDEVAPDFIFNAAALLATDSRSQSEFSPAWAALRGSLANVSEWRYPPALLCEGVKALAIGSSASTINSLAEEFKAASEEFLEEYADAWVEGLTTLLESMEDPVKSFPLGFQLNVSKSALFVSLLKRIVDAGMWEDYPTIAARFSSQANGQECIDHLRNVLAENGYDENSTGLAFLLIEVGGEINWGQLRNAVKENLEKSDHREGVLNAMRIALRLRSTNSNLSPFNEYSQGPGVFSLIERAVREDDYEALGVAFLFLLEFNPRLSVREHSGESQKGLDRVQDLHEWDDSDLASLMPTFQMDFSSTGNSRNWTRLISGTVNHPQWRRLFRAYVPYCLSCGRFGRFPINSFVQSLSDLIHALPASEGRKLLNQLVSSGKFWRALKDSATDELLPKIWELLGAEDGRAAEVEKVFLSRVSNKSAEWWRSEIAKDSVCLSFLMKLFSLEREISVQDNVVDEIESRMWDIIKGRYEARIIDRKLVLLVSDAQPDRRDTFVRDFVEHMASAETAAGEKARALNLFSLSWDVILQLSKDPDRFVRSIVIPVFRGQESDEINRIAEVGDAISELVSKARVSTRRQLRARVEEYCKNEVDETTSETIKQLVDDWQLPRPPDKRKAKKKKKKKKD